MSQSKEESKIEPINPSNHLKPDTIWHTAVGPRDDTAQEYDERYPAKKRRVSCGIEIVKCNICGYHFDSPAQLSDHLLHHDSDYRFNPIYKCSYGQCMFRTDDRPLMKHHISRVHLKSDQALISKKYRNRKFLRPTILCSTCPMVFATEAELWQHTPNCKEYRCQFCGQHFWTIEKRYSHELAYHEEEFEYEEEEEEEGATENRTETEHSSAAAPSSSTTEQTEKETSELGEVKTSQEMLQEPESSQGETEIEDSVSDAEKTEIVPGNNAETDAADEQKRATECEDDKPVKSVDTLKLSGNNEQISQKENKCENSENTRDAEAAENGS